MDVADVGDVSMPSLRLDELLRLSVIVIEVASAVPGDAGSRRTTMYLFGEGLGEELTTQAWTLSAALRNGVQIPEMP